MRVARLTPVKSAPLKRAPPVENLVGELRLLSELATEVPRHAVHAYRMNHRFRPSAAALAPIVVYGNYLAPARARRGAGPARAAGRVRRGETVLVVEDDASLRGAVTRMLEGAGYRVLAARDGNEASVECRAGTAIDLLLTDVVMPGMSGRELGDRLRAAHPGLRVIYMSGYTDDAIVHHGVLEDRLHFLQKPFTSEALLGKVRAALDAERA